MRVHDLVAIPDTSYNNTVSFALMQFPVPVTQEGYNSQAMMELNDEHSNTS